MQRVTQRVGQTAAIALLMMAAAASGGCPATSRVDGSGVAYANGNSEGVVDAGSEQVLAAAREVLREWEMIIVDEELERAFPRLTARTPAERRVRVWVEQVPGGRTRMWVRYGTFGDVNQSTELFTQIANRAEQG